MPKIKEQYWTSDEAGRSILAVREVGDEDTGEDNGMVAAAERMGTRQVIAGEDPATQMLDQRGLEDVPTVETRRSYEAVEDARPEDMAANGREPGAMTDAGVVGEASADAPRRGRKARG